MSKSLIERLRADAVLFDVNPEDDVQGLNATALLEREAADELERMVRMTDFIYLLNAMENAAAQENPSKHDYSGKRQAVLNYVDALKPRSDAHTDHPLRHYDRTCPACAAEADKERA